VITAVGDKFTPDEAAIIEAMLREHAGTIPDAQLFEEIDLPPSTATPATPAHQTGS